MVLCYSGLTLWVISWIVQSQVRPVILWHELLLIKKWTACFAPIKVQIWGLCPTVTTTTFHLPVITFRRRLHLKQPGKTKQGGLLVGVCCFRDPWHEIRSNLRPRSLSWRFVDTTLETVIVTFRVNSQIKKQGMCAACIFPKWCHLAVLQEFDYFFVAGATAAPTCYPPVDTIFVFVEKHKQWRGASEKELTERSGWLRKVHVCLQATHQQSVLGHSALT